MWLIVCPLCCLQCFHFFNTPTHPPPVHQLSSFSFFLNLTLSCLTEHSLLFWLHSSVGQADLQCSCFLCPNYAGHCNGVGFSWIVDGVVCGEVGHTWSGTQERKSSIPSDDSFRDPPLRWRCIHMGKSQETSVLIPGHHHSFHTRLVCGPTVFSYSQDVLNPVVTEAFFPPVTWTVPGVDWNLPRGLIKIWLF